MPHNYNSEEPRVGYFYITLFVVVLAVIVCGIIHFLNSMHIL